MDVPGDGYADEVEDEHGAGEEAHADGIGHGADDRGDDEDRKDGVAEVAEEKPRVDNAEEREEEDEDGELEADAQTKDDREEEAGVVIDGDHVVEVLAEVEDEDLDGSREDPAIAEPCAAEKEEYGRSHEGEDVLFLVGIHAGGDEEPDLVQDEGAGEDGAADEGGFDDEVDRIRGMGLRHHEAVVDERLLQEGDELVVKD